MDTKDKVTTLEVTKLVKDSLDKAKANRTEVDDLSRRLSELETIDTYEELSQYFDDGTITSHVSAGDEILVNKITGLTITSSNSALSFTVTDAQVFMDIVGRVDDETYTMFRKNSAWVLNDNVVTDFGFTISGTPADNDEVYVKMTYDTISHTFVDFNTTGTNATKPVDTSVTCFSIVEQTYTIDSGFNFDAPESAICVTVGNTLSAGKYYVYNVAGATSDYWCNYKRLYYLFEIANDITATSDTGDIQLRYVDRGARETTGDARGWYILTTKPYRCSDDTLYNSDTITFNGQVSAPDDTYTDIRTIEGFTTDQSMTSEGIIYNNLGHVCLGNNEWAVSNLRQRMNSRDLKMSPVRMHKNDIVTGLKNVKGYMYGLDPRFVGMVYPCTVYMEHGLNDEFTWYALYTCDDTATLLSMKEMSFNIQTNEGVVTELYDTYCDHTLTNSAIASRGKANKAGATPSEYRWSRSAFAYNSNDAWLVAPSGASYSNVAYCGYRFAPAYLVGKIH